jgi:putative DNA primase/helicase
MIKPAENVVDLDERRGAEQAAKDLVPVLSEDQIALEFVNRNHEYIRFCDKSQRWHVWTGSRWQPDKSDIAFSWTRAVVRTMAGDQSAANRRRMGSSRFKRGVEALARTDQRIKHSTWDANIEALGTPSGIVDLQTGELFPPDAEQFITRNCAVDPADIPDCLRWLQFINEITNGDAGLKTLLQQWAGYCLTGETSEQKLVFIYGPGGSGKSVFANTLRRFMGEYATTADMSTFTDGRGFEQHAQQFARLDGMRMVVASETEAEHKWRENRVKQLTGGDPMVANFMRQNSFEFTPQFKLTFVGNHAPGLVNLDTAIKRRFLLLPFVNRPETPDLHLEKILIQEWPGILRWAINGAIDWYARGLIIPAVVDHATTEYFEDQDIFGAWIEECCDVEPGNQFKFESSAGLFKSWSAFVQSRGDHAGNQRSFNERLRRKGLKLEQIKALGTTGWRGIRLKHPTHLRDDL